MISLTNKSLSLKINFFGLILIIKYVNYNKRKLQVLVNLNTINYFIILKPIHFIFYYSN